MQQSLENTGGLRSRHLDPENYAFSLLREGERAGAISSQEAASIQGRLMEELAATVLRYTGNESTSVKEETARGLLESLVYSIDRYLLFLLQPRIALSALKECEMSELRKKGTALLREDAIKAKALLETIRTGRVDTDLIAYNDTLDALAEFFKKYDVLYAAHDIPCSIDYPLSQEVGGRGVTYMCRYLQILKLEEQFCGQFDKKEIDLLVRASGYGVGMEGRDLLINLFELVFGACVFSLLAMGEARPRLLSAEQCEELSLKLSPLTEMQVSALITEVVNRLCGFYAADDSPLADYLVVYGKKFDQKLALSLKAGDIRPLVLMQPVGEGPVSYQDGQKMDNEELRELIEEIRQAPSPEKAALLKQVKSLADFVEILNADLLYGKEIEEAFSLLDDTALAALGKQSGIYDFDLADSPLDSEWQRTFLLYVKRLPQERQAAVTEWMTNFE